MPFVQSYKRRTGNVLRIATVAIIVLAIIAGCSDGAEEAAEAGALARQQLEAGDVAAARKSIREAISARDDVVELHLLRGRIEYAAGSPGTAYDAYAEALSLDATNAEALSSVSQLGLSTGHMRESLQATERILSLSPNQPDALLVRGIHALVRRRYDEAIVYADRILSMSPAHENASILKARALFLQGEHEAALATVNAAKNAAGSPAIAETKLEIFRELRRPQEMAEQFRLLRQSRPADAALRVDEANFRFKLGERAAAHSLLTDALSEADATRELAENAVQLWLEYGVQDLPARQLDSIARSGSTVARQAVTRLLIESGNHARAARLLSALRGNDRLGLLARLHHGQGKHALARTVADAVLAKDATQCDALVAHSDANRALRNPKAALQSGQRAAAECPNIAGAWLAAAGAYRALERPSGAERVYKQAIDTLPQDLRMTRAYTGWLLQEKRRREALAVARRLTRNAPALLGGWRHYAAVCRRAGDSCEAEAERGLADARTLYGIDLEPGATPSNGLTGRLARR